MSNEGSRDGDTTLHNRAKLFLARGLGLDHATLHVHVGMVIWVAGVALTRDLADWRPLAAVWAAELFNEVLDRLRNGEWLPRDTLGDIVNSVLWPTILFALARAGVI